MKYLPIILAVLISRVAFGQTDFPGFLQGTWKMENKEIYEHWDKLNDKNLKGFSYRLSGGQMNVSEYLEITQQDSGTIYTASVLGQNQGEGVDFKLTGADSTFTFENPGHDFPKKIVYQRLSDTELQVSVTDGTQKGFAYKMIRQQVIKTETDPAVTNPVYDKILAEKLGGDDYGMKSYFLVILKTGPDTSADRDLISESFRGHMDNINRLVEEGKLIVAGPLGKNENNYRGIFILNDVPSIEEAGLLLQTDPAIKNGLLDYEIFTWYGSAALPEYLPFSDKIWKSKP